MPRRGRPAPCRVEGGVEFGVGVGLLAAGHHGTTCSCRVATMRSAARSARAQIVDVGLTPPDVTKQLPSTTYRLATSWARFHSSTTDVAGSRAHAGRSQEVPTRIAHQPIDLDRVGAGLDERLGRLLDVEVEQAPGVVRHAVVQLGGRQTRGVGGRCRQADLVRLVGEILTEQTPAGATPEAVAHVDVMRLAPDLLARPARQRGVDRTRRSAPGPTWRRERTRGARRSRRTRTTRSSTRSGPASSRGSRRTAR